MTNANTSGLSPEMLKVFETLPNHYLVLSRELVILTASDAYLQLTGKTREAIHGQYLFNIFPEVPAWTNQDGGMTNSLSEVLRTGRAHYMPVTRVDLPDPRTSGLLCPRYWRTSNTPVLDEAGRIGYIIHQTEDISGQILNEQQLMSLNEELAQANEELQTASEQTRAANEALAQANENLEATVALRTRELAAGAALLKRIIMTTPVGLTIFRGRDFIIDMANQPVLTIWGRTTEQVTGRRLLDVFPELEGQPFPDMLNRVLDTGETVSLSEIGVDVNQPDGSIKRFYVDFSYDALFDLDGRPEAILVSVKDITELAENRQLLQQQKEELEAMNEELAASNEEITTTNEELYAANEELAQTQNRLQGLINELAESESRFRSLIEQSPVAMMVNRGNDMRFDIINQAMIDLIGKGDVVRGRTILDAIPELEGQPVIDQLYHTYRTGEVWTGRDQPIMLEYKGQWGIRYYDIIYKPLWEEGQITGVIQAASDVTEQVKARHQLEESLAEKIKLTDDLRATYEQLNLARNAAQLGTFDWDLINNVYTWDARFKEMFGVDADADFPDNSVFVERLHPDDRERTRKTVLAARDPNGDGNYDIEYRIIGDGSGAVRWARAKGKVIFDAQRRPVRFIGMIMDISDFKENEQRKNDFIAMVSHELKTPLTSMYGYIQIMQLKANRNGDTGTNSILEKARKQAGKMTTLINGFLDVARLEAGKIHIDKESIDVADILNEAADGLVSEDTSHNIVFHPAPEIRVMADKDKIEQVINNLISNAIKYAPAGSSIQIYCSVINDYARICVSDEGMGIDPEDQPRLFDRFYRVEGRQTQTISGFGIGLYLCREIVQRHNGEIWVESEPGKGAKFCFTLPLS